MIQNNRRHKNSTATHDTTTHDTAAQGATNRRTPKGDKKPRAAHKTIVEQVLSVLVDNKAENIITLDVRGKVSFTDYMIIASGRSKRHINAVADYLHRALKNSGIKNIHIEGLPNCDWVLVDAGDVLIHIFRPEVRDFYKIEKMWQADIMDAQLQLNQAQLNNE